MFHKHKWKEIARTYNEPQQMGKIFDDYFSKQCLWGFTQILWECEICKKLRKEELLGKII